MIEEILDALAQRRKALLWAYFSACLVVITVILHCDTEWLPDILIWCLGGPSTPSCSGSHYGAKAITIGILLGPHLAFLWGGGHISDRIRKHQFWRNLPAIIVTALVVAANVLGLLMTFADWADRSGGTRGEEYHGVFALEEDWSGYVFAASVVAVFFFCLFRRIHNVGQRTALVGLIRVLLFATWLNFSLALPTLLVANTYPGGSLIPFSVFGFYFGVYELLWCVGIAIYLLRPQPLRAGPSPLSKRTAAVKGGPYIDSARMIASFLLVVSYFGVQQAVSHASALDQMIESRQAFAEDLVRNYLVSFADFQNWRGGEGKSASPYLIYDWLKQRLPQRLPRVIPWADSVEVRVVTISTAGFLFFGPSEFERFEVTVQEYKTTRPWVARVGIDFSLATDSIQGLPEVAKVAIRNGIKPEKDEDFASLYFRTESELLRKQVALLSSGFLFPVGQVVWICSLVTLAMLVLLDDRIRNVFRDPDLERGEPWLILDAERGIARLLTWMWIGALFVGPWLISVMTTRMASLEVRSGGSVSYLVYDLFTYWSLALLTAGSSFLSLMVICDILQLRRLQRLQASAAEGVPSSIET